jgi:hypothetical protein
MRPPPKVCGSLCKPVQGSAYSCKRIRSGRSRIVKHGQGRASPCKYGKCVSGEEPKGGSPCRLEQETCWILAGRGASRVRGPTSDAAAPLGASGRGLLGVCAATAYRMCEQGKLEHFRVRDAIRAPIVALKTYLARARRRAWRLRGNWPSHQGAGHGHHPVGQNHLDTLALEHLPGAGAIRGLCDRVAAPVKGDP